MAADGEFPEFDGKTVAFYATGFKAVGALISPRFEEQGGRLFVVGEAATSSGNWAEGASAAIAWDEVRSYIALDSDVWVFRRANRNRKKNATWSLWHRK